MTLAFDEVKTTQTAARFLKLAGESLNYMALIKLLYKADREALRRWGLPITTDKYVSMAKGPVTSHIYDRIKTSANKNSHPAFWSSYIQKDADPLLVKMISDPGDSELSCAEEKLIAEIFATDGGKGPVRAGRRVTSKFPRVERSRNFLSPPGDHGHSGSLGAFRGRISPRIIFD